jgi:hypothetical protein
MQIELTGPTGAGKSTLARAILGAARTRGLAIDLRDDALLRPAGMDGLRRPLARTLAIDAIALAGWPATRREHGALWRLALAGVARAPAGPYERLNMARNALKNLALHGRMRRVAPGRAVLVDEGTLQVAHYLFVHVSAPPPAEALVRFAELVPLPDVVVHVTGPEEALVRRTLARGHRRIPGAAPPVVGAVVRHALETFARLRAHAVAEGRLRAVALPPSGAETRGRRTGLPGLLAVVAAAAEEAGLAGHVEVLVPAAPGSPADWELGSLEDPGGLAAAGAAGR